MSLENTHIQEAIDWYIKNQSLYQALAGKIENILKELIQLDSISYHAIFSRAKEIESFANKVTKKEYKNPTTEIKDFAGIRIITYVESEIEPICKIIEANFSIDKEHSLDKSDELGVDKVGYKSVHYVAKLKKERLLLPEYKRFKDKYFEIQVRTILQHAWAEIEHDRNYKFTGKLPKKIQRRFSLLAGTLESADLEFNSISNEIDSISKAVEIATEKGQLDIPINSTSLKQYMLTKFPELFENGGEIQFPNSEREIKVLNELEKFGIKKLQDLDSIIPIDFVKNEIETGAVKGTRLTGFLIDILIINDYKKYFEQVWSSTHWARINNESVILYEKYSVPIRELAKEYEIEIIT